MPVSGLVQLQVHLRKIDPPIWRRLIIPNFLSLADLHDILQISVGWTDQHQYQFQIDKCIYGEPEYDVDDPFGMMPMEGFMYPACVGGGRSCPPEGVGGPLAYLEMLRSLADLHDEKRLQYLKWLGGVFDPEGMDANRINAELWSYDWSGSTH